MNKNYVTIQLSEGKTCKVEIERLSERENVANKIFDFSDVRTQIEYFTNEISNTLKKINPSKTTLEFGVELGIESGVLTTLIAKGTAKSNIKIIVEWERNNEKI